MARLRRPRTDDPTRLAVFADPHVSTRSTGTSKLFEHTRAHLERTVADINTRDADLALCVGDITKDGEPWNYEAADDILADLEVPFLAIPGNHDVRKEGDEHESLPLAEFVERYTPGSLPFVHRVRGVDVVGLNSAGGDDWLTDSHDGLVPQAQLDWLDETLPTLETPLVAVHHNLPTMAAQLREHRAANEPEMAVPPVLRNPEAFIEVLARHDAPLVLTGHLHMPAAAEMHGVRELMAPTTCSFPQAYLLVDVGPGGTAVRMVPVVDHEGMMLGHRERHADSATARGLTNMAAIRLAQFPLVDET